MNEIYKLDSIRWNSYEYDQILGNSPLLLTWRNDQKTHQYMEEAVEAIFPFPCLHYKSPGLAEAIFIMQVGRVEKNWRWREKIQKALQIARCSFFLGQWQLKLFFNGLNPRFLGEMDCNFDGCIFFSDGVGSPTIGIVSLDDHLGFWKVTNLKEMALGYWSCRPLANWRSKLRCIHPYLGTLWWFRFKLLSTTAVPPESL